MRRPTLNRLPPGPPGKMGWPWTTQSPMLAKTMPGEPYWPRISIVTPSYNQSQFIEETIRSVLLQGYPNLEYIVIDGGSTDGSVEVIRKYDPWLSYWVSEPDRGQSHAINKGWAISTGEIIGWLNSDDFYVAGALQRVAKEFRQSRHTAVLAGECIKVDGSATEIYRKGAKSFDPVAILTSSKPAQASTFYRRYTLDEIGVLREDLHYCMDREFALRIGERYFPDSTLNVPIPLAYFRVWPGRKTSRGDSQAVRERIRVAEQFLERYMLTHRHRGLRRKAYRKVYSDQARRERAKGDSARELMYISLATLYSGDLRTLREPMRCLARIAVDRLSAARSRWATES